MQKLAEKYADSFKYLVALYAVTTQVTRKDAAALAGVTPWNWHKTYEEPMLQEVRSEFAQVFLERHSYMLPEQQPAENQNSNQFTSPSRIGVSSTSTPSVSPEQSGRRLTTRLTAMQRWTSDATQTHFPSRAAAR